MAPSQRLIRLLREMARVGEQIIPGSDFAEVKESLESDPRGTANSTDELVEYVERLSSEAVEDLADTHFEVSDAIRPLTVQIAPAGAPLGVYYIRPSEDFSRPGGVWHSIGDQRVFPLYQHISTAYHEGFPGHSFADRHRYVPEGESESCSACPHLLPRLPGGLGHVCRGFDG